MFCEKEGYRTEMYKGRLWSEEVRSEGGGRLSAIKTEAVPFITGVNKV